MGTITVSASGEYATLTYLEPAPVQGPFSTTDPRDPRLGVPTDAALVYWNPAWTYLHQAFNALGANDILVLPERTAPYLLDASKGFLASGVSSVSDHGAIFQGPQWFALARAKRGILGLGPNARIEIAAGNRILGQQTDDGDPAAVPPRLPRYATFTDGHTQNLIGCAESAIEFRTARGYVGNFTFAARDLGGVAYHMLGLGGSADDTLIERINLLNSQGFSAVPNGESGAIASGADRTTIRRLVVNDSKSSPIMLNSCTGTLIEDVTLRRAGKGMPTLWNCSGTHTLRRFRSEQNEGAALNIEKPASTFSLVWDQGAALVDKPTGGYYNLHLKIGSSTSSIKVALTGVAIDNGPWPGSLSVQLYAGASGKQKATDVTAVSSTGVVIPVRYAGTTI